MKRIFLTFFISHFLLLSVISQVNNKKVFVININEDINSKMWVYLQKGISQAKANASDMIIISINTYGGELNFADSIATKLINTKIPTIAFIDNNAASAGALISIACDRIYMREGSRIGAATVVNGVDGQAMPDKYQSYMRGIMRSVAEAKGRDSVGNWVRDPLIAEAMVDPRIVVKGIDDSTKTLTFTTSEAIKNGYCEGKVENIKQILELEHIEKYDLQEFKPSFWDYTKGLLTSTFIRGLLITLIIAGIWFELQQPGIGFPLALAIVAVILYFAPLYIDGLAANWEIIIFVIGVLLLAVEIFVIPGFGVAGVAGILLIFLGLTLSLLDNYYFNFNNVPSQKITSAVLTVIVGIVVGFSLMLYVSSKIGSKGVFSKLALKSNQKLEDGFIGVPTEQKLLLGTIGKSVTDLRPAGKVEIDGKIYDAVSLNGKYILNNTEVKVFQYSTGQIIVENI